MTKKLLKISKYKPSILQGSLEFASPVSLAAEHPRERMLMQVLFVCLVACICCYLYFITASVLNVMARREALAQIDNIRGTIGATEQRYLALASSVTPQDAAGLGLAPVSSSDTHYIYRPGNIGAATIAGNAN